MKEKTEKLIRFYAAMSSTKLLDGTEQHQYRKIFLQTNVEWELKMREVWDLERKLNMYADALIPNEKHFNKSPSSSDKQ